ncbi:major facilitator superfamily domain-containing protein [Ilyonectria robusta]|uniref:major facilitator superfamily domain-containing protein n=1 Tax=Ilyonectria robusta TaxID=1079257 RepID=UPI001E8DEC2B|nr:major facilitator superfamily domain-containing protein [Ilyonectria robusta]KAH8679284.1 major facilitator superfamily domain-containing protein [Ilyonectria robusta]
MPKPISAGVLTIFGINFSSRNTAFKLAMADSKERVGGNTAPEATIEKHSSLSISDAVNQPPATKTNEHKIDGDAALQLLSETGGLTTPPDPERSRRLIRRIDFHIMPLICIVYFLQYIDKTAISYASVTGIIQSTGLKGNEFNWVASIFFFGQLAFEFPTIRLIQLFPLAKYVSINVTLWGATLAAMAACTNYSGLLACRFFLGVLEAAIVPAWVLFTSQWYTKEEQAFRVGIWFSVCGAAQMFGGYFAYGVATHVGKDPNAALEGWQIVFLFLGLLTSLVGITFWFVMPDSPAVAGFLSKEEKSLHLERIRGNEQGIGTQAFKWKHVNEALTDPMTWLYAFWIFAANIPNSIATSFGNILVTGMGYSREESLLLVTPLGAWEIVALLGLTYAAMKTRQRLYFCVLGHIPAIIGAILMATTEKVPALIGYYTSGGIPIGWTTILGLQSSNVAGSTKKITVACIGTIAYTVGNIISPHTFQARDAPRYLPAKVSICIIYFLITVDLLVMRWVFDRRNKKRDQERVALGDAYQVEDNHEFFDLTDLENREFRYEL